MLTDNKDYPNCEVCGKKVNFPNAKKYNLCWEVMSRIDAFLESEAGKSIIINKLVALGVKQ